MGFFGEDGEVREEEAFLGVFGGVLIAKMEEAQHCLVLEAGVQHSESKIVFNKESLKFIIGSASKKQSFCLYFVIAFNTGK